MIAAIRLPRGLVVGGLSLATLAAIALGLALGTHAIALGDLLTGNLDRLDRLVLVHARLPRVGAAWCVGAALAMAGTVMQVWTRNPMAGPGLLGLNGGAAAALSLAVVVDPLLTPIAMAAIAMAGAGGGGLLVLGVAAAIPAGRDPLRLVIIGAAVSALLASVTAAVVIASGMQNDLLYWMVGGLGAVGWREVILLAVAIAGSTVIARIAVGDLALAALGTDVATALGARLGRLRWLIAALVILATGTANAVAGPVGFIGFLAPHLGRGLVGPDPRRLLPVAATLGGSLVVVADAVGRIIAPPDEQPLGLFLALLGGPVLIAVARRQGGPR